MALQRLRVRDPSAPLTYLGVKTMEKEIWYVMLVTLQGKHGLLVAEEIYQESEIVAEGFSLQALVETNQMKLFR